MAGGLTESRAAAILGRELGNGWDLSPPLGSMQATRIARRGSRAVAVKLTPTPPPIMRRLAALGVTPPVLGCGEDEGSGYVIQQAVEGPHPDHEWFLTNRAAWAAMVGRYLNDPQLHDLLSAQPGFWRLTVPAAVDMINRDLTRVPGDSPALGTSAFRMALERWRQQAEAIPRLPWRPIHPDAHWHNYVIADGAALLLDWDHIDLSDPLRDVGAQVWGFLPPEHWEEFLRAVRVPLRADSPDSVYWWAAFKAVSNALFNDTQRDPGGAEFHVDLFLAATDRRPWLDRAPVPPDGRR